jgi:hypothetical protein
LPLDRQEFSAAFRVEKGCQPALTRRAASAVNWLGHKKKTAANLAAVR